MSENTYLWHKEYAPNGRIFDLERISLASLVEEGYVDNPGKLGINVWGGENKAMTELKTKFERGEVKAIGTVVMEARHDEIHNLKRENQKTYERLRTTEDENAALKRELRESKEKLGDHRSDGAKLEEKRAATQVQVKKPPAPAGEQKAAGHGGGDETSLG